VKEWAREGAPELAVVLAEAQTAGRGRQGRAWASPRGNLHLSVLLRPPTRLAGLLPLLGGVATAQALAELGAHARLKWPNDVLVGERKMAGILAEASSGPQGVEWVALGIGANLHPSVPLPEGATSLCAETGRVVEPAEAAAAVLRQLRVWYDRAATGQVADLRAAWRERSVPWWGRLVEARAGEQVIRGIATDIDEDGALLLGLEGGRLARVVSGEVSRLRLL
jgi:BirA family biotin operon repressor/biotin-[acetyl-CoA-carboxylase] ligase